ncbi:hypothetical protein LCGC14_2597960, partial [marine sediment metagenome]
FLYAIYHRVPEDPSWQGCKVGNVTYYREDVNGFVLWQDGFYMSRRVQEKLTEYNTLMDREWALKRYGAKGSGQVTYDLVKAKEHDIDAAMLKEANGLPDLEDVVDWWGRWPTWVAQAINDWWSGTGTAVQDWIAVAIAELEGAWEDWLYFWNITWPAWLAQFETLRASWDNFWTGLYPSLVSFTWLTTWWTSTMGEVQDLIDSAFTVRDSLWSGWQELRDQVVEFFTDPWAWLYNRFDDFIERFW